MVINKEPEKPHKQGRFGERTEEAERNKVPGPGEISSEIWISGLETKQWPCLL
jgi:hypothetical protein